LVLLSQSPIPYFSVCAGKVSILEDAALDSFHSEIGKPVTGDDGDPKLRLTAHDIYKELRLRGYDYGKTFQGILESNNAGVCVRKS
jgi:fatty acid synthase